MVREQLAEQSRPAMQTNEQYRLQEAPPAVVRRSIVPAERAPCVTMPLSDAIVRTRPNPTLEGGTIAADLHRLATN